MLTPDEQSALLTLIDDIAYRRQQNREDAAAIAALGCQCSGDPHARSCPISIAIEVVGTVIVAGPTEEAKGKDIRHLVDPGFRAVAEASRPIRAECAECGRYAVKWELIHHKEGCPNR